MYQGSYRIELYKALFQGVALKYAFSPVKRIVFREVINGLPKKFTARYDNECFADYSTCGHNLRLSEESQSSILNGRSKQRKSSPDII